MGGEDRLGLGRDLAGHGWQDSPASTRSRTSGLASEDPFEFHRAFCDLPLPGRSVRRDARDAPGASSNLRPGRGGRGAQDPDLRPRTGTDPRRASHGPFGSDTVLLAVRRPDAPDAHPDIGTPWGDGGFTIRRGVLVALATAPWERAGGRRAARRARPPHGHAGRAARTAPGRANLARSNCGPILSWIVNRVPRSTVSDRKERRCPSETDTSPASPAGSTRASPTLSRRHLLQRPVRMGVRGRDAAGVGGKYFIARIRGGDAAAVGSIPEAAPPWPCGTPTFGSRARTRPRRRCAMPGAASSWSRSTSWTPAGWRCSPIPRGGVLRLAGEGAQGRAVVNEHGSLNFNDLNTRDVGRRQGLLRRGLRLADARAAAAASRCGRCPATATTSSATIRSSASRWPRWARRMGSRTWSRRSYRSRTISGHAAALERHVRGRRRGRHRGEGDELGGKVVAPPLDAPWVRMTVIADPQGATFTASAFVPENRELATQAGAA